MPPKSALEFSQAWRVPERVPDSGKVTRLSQSSTPADKRHSKAGSTLPLSVLRLGLEHEEVTFSQAALDAVSEGHSSLQNEFIKHF